MPDQITIIHESMFHRVRSAVLQTAMDRLEPRPLGRPPQHSSLHDLRIAELEEENRRLHVELRAAEVRRELAEKLPRLAGPIVAEYQKAKGYRLIVPRGVKVKTIPSGGICFTVRESTI